MSDAARGLLDVLFATIWQGALIALGARALLAATGYRSNARTRCIVLQVALVAITLVPLVTTLPNVVLQAPILHPSGITRSPVALGRASQEAWLPVAHRIDVILNDRSVLTLVAAWLVGVLTLTLRIVAGSLQLARLAKRSYPTMSRGGVTVYASADIRVPLALGFVEPAIIIPEVLAAQADETLECIVLHELAHVRRRDAYANACECAIHALLYFNPAVWLVLRAIALERESACDDWAVVHARDLAAYTRSLASFAIFRADGGSAATYAAPGFGHATLTRIHRLEDHRRNGALALSRYAIGGFTLVLLTLALTLNSFAPAIAFASQAPIPNAAVASNACPATAVRYVRGPAPLLTARLPSGLKTLVHVRVSTTGKPLSAALYKTSGNAAFDQAVLNAAKKGEYAPEIRDCQPMAGSYIFTAITG